MAAALLIGTNAWAAFQVVGGGSHSTLQAAIDEAPAGATTTIEMTASWSGNENAWLVTVNTTDPVKHIILDLKGNEYTYTGNNKVAIGVAHGTLEIKSTGEEGLMKATNASKANDLFRVYGTYEEIDAKANANNAFARLIIRENVQIKNEKTDYNAISIDVMRPDQPALFGLTDAAKLPKYRCDFFDYEPKTGGWGVANGARVDVYGKVTGNKYGIKVNGCVRYVKEYLQTGTLTWKTNYPRLKDNYEPKYNGGSNNGTYNITSAEGEFAPYVFVAPSGYVETSATSGKAVAAYSSGFGRWRIEGYCGGSTGLYAKSGQIEIVNGTVQSTNTTATQPVAQNSGVNAGGSAIVIESNANYSGGTSVVIAGDSKIEATAGYAIQETITNAGESKVTSVDIQGGTIQGGTQGAMIVENDTKDVVTIVGGNYQGDVQVKGNTVQTVDVKDFIPSGTQSHTTEVIVDNKVVVVVSAGEPPVVKNTVIGATPGTNVKWNGTDPETLNVDLTLGELEINEADEQELTIAAGKKLTVTRLILGENARIIVEAGGKLVVTGPQGIVAPVVENILLKTSEAAQAILLFDPNVSSNRHPNATVQMHSKAYRDANTGKYVWQRFGVPTYNSELRRTDIYNANATPTAWRKISHQEWVSFDANEGMVPFVCYGLTTNQPTAQGVYVFECPLMGNDNISLSLEDEWNYFANSYMSPIDIKAMLGALVAGVEGTLYLYRPSDNWWYELNNGAYTFGDEDELPLDIDPMQAFIIHRKAASAANQVINYENQIWKPIMESNTSGAPARSRNSFNKAMVEIAAADGTKDYVRMIEDAQFSADFDNSYDASKYMNENSFNLFAGEQLGIIATDNLEGTALTLNTKDQTSFTMTISHVNGMDYAIRDNLTGTEIAMVEGATYMFSVPANTTVEGRFEIVPMAKMPTAIENIEETAAVKGIYTVSGQFVGNDYHSLPNGVYVVDGQKIVK